MCAYRRLSTNHWPAKGNMSQKVVFLTFRAGDSLTPGLDNTRLFMSITAGSGTGGKVIFTWNPELVRLLKLTPCGHTFLTAIPGEALTGG